MKNRVILPLPYFFVIVITCCLPKVIYAQPIGEGDKNEAVFASMILRAYEEENLPFSERLVLSNELIANSPVIVRGSILDKELRIVEDQIYEVLQLEVSHVFRGDTTYENTTTEIWREVEEKEGLQIENGKVVVKNYFHSYEPGLFKGLEYIIFCQLDDGELRFYQNNRMSFLNRNPNNKNIWTGLYGHVYKSFERLQKHFSLFREMRGEK